MKITNKELQRMKELMGNKKSINENINLSNIELKKKAPNGKIYGVVKEIKKYFIKESTDGINFDFIGGVANKTKNQYNSFEEAVRRLNLMIEDSDVLTSDLIQEKKFVIKTKKKKKKKVEEPETEEDTTEEGGDFDFGGEEGEEGEGEDTGDFDFGGEEGEGEEGEGEEGDFDFGGEEGEGEEGEGEEGEEGDDFDFGGGEEEEGEEGDDFGGEEGEEGGEEGDDEDLDRDDSIKSIQRLTGKLGQKLRDTEDKSSDLSKWVAKSVLSALSLEDMDSDDKKDLIRTIKKKKEDEEFDFMEDSDMVDWNQLSPSEKAEILSTSNDAENEEEDVMCSACNGLGYDDYTEEECEWCAGTGLDEWDDYMTDEDEPYGPSNGKKGSVILDDEDENCSYCGDRDYRQPYDDEQTDMDYPGMGPDWRRGRMDYMSKYAKNVKKAKGQKLEQHEIQNFVEKVKNKLGGSDNVSIDGDKVVGDFGYVQVTSRGYSVHKEGQKLAKNFTFSELGKLHDYVREGDNEDYMYDPYMEDPYMMPQPAPARPQERPETPVKPGRPDTDRPSPSKRPFTPPPHITPGEEPGPKAWEEDEYGDEYGDEYYGPTEGMDYMEDGYYGSWNEEDWYSPGDMGKSFNSPSYEYDEFEYPDYESFRSSEFGQDPENKWFPQDEKGKFWFDRYSTKFGPMKIRKPKPKINYDETSEYFEDFMEDDEDMEVCQSCEGRGHEQGAIGFGRTPKVCLTCAGSGHVPRMEADGEVDEPYVDSANPMGYQEEPSSTLPKGMKYKLQYKEKFNFPFNMGENSRRNKKPLKKTI